MNGERRERKKKEKRRKWRKIFTSGKIAVVNERDDQEKKRN
jgi:hypothetical protein